MRAALWLLNGTVGHDAGNQDFMNLHVIVHICIFAYESKAGVIPFHSASSTLCMNNRWAVQIMLEARVGISTSDQIMRSSNTPQC